MPREMTESEISALLDAHDALVRACVDSRLAFEEFVATYDDFPSAYALDEQAVLRLFRKRVAFHERVAGVVSGLRSDGDSKMSYGDVARFTPTVGLMRLRELVAKYPEFKAEAGKCGRGACDGTRAIPCSLVGTGVDQRTRCPSAAR